MSLAKLSGVASATDGFFARTLNAPMDRREFLAMSGGLILSLIGVNSLLQVVAKHTGGTSPVNLMQGQADSFGTRKFGR